MRLLHTVLGMLGGIAGLLVSPISHAGFSCEGRVGTALILAIDTSSSIEPHEMQLEKFGYVNAFRDPDVIHAIQSTECGVALTVMIWSSPAMQLQVIPWQRLYDDTSIMRFAYELQKMDYETAWTTSIAGAINFSFKLFETLPYETERKILDISGDGRDDDTPYDGDTISVLGAIEILKGSMGWFDFKELIGGAAVPGQTTTLELARREAYQKGITINGLAIQGDYTLEGDIYEFYEKYVKTPDGFVEKAHDFSDFTRAIESKLVRELM